MNVPIKIKVSLDLANRLEASLKDVRAAHLEETKEVTRKIMLAGPTDALVKRQAELQVQGKRLTIPYLVRACVLAGISVLNKKPADLLAIMCADTVKKGPQSGRAA